MKSFRLYHLIFGVAVAAAYFSAEELGLVHAWLGYGIAALLVLRVLFGLARRTGFAFARLRPRLWSVGKANRGLRHPMLAHTLTLALFVSIAGAAGTGIAMDQGGTLVGQSIRASEDHEATGPRHREHGEDEEEGALSELHEFFGNSVLPLALLHIAYLLLWRRGMAQFMLFLPQQRKPSAPA